MRSVMEHSFSQLPRAEIPRSTFDRSHGLKTTFDADWLIPIYVDDVIPGDTFRMNANFMGRLATPLHPIMDNMFFETFFFFVPYRLIWDDFKKFHGERVDPDDSIDYTVPVVSSAGGTVTTGSLFDYFGLPLRSGLFDQVSALPFRAYNLIWNEWFRDQNLQDSVTVNTASGHDGLSVNYTLLKRGKRHDYFTSSLPSPQKGASVRLPLGSLAPVTGATGSASVINSTLGTEVNLLQSTTNDNILIHTSKIGTTQQLYADLADATAATINDLRLAFQTQRLLERDARGGTRYNELIRAHFGVTVPDFRVQRPEYIGGGSSMVNVTPVANTAGQSGDYVGQLGAMGTVSGSHDWTYSAVEHGLIIGLVNVRGDITYSQGVERYWSKSTRYDFYYPVLAQIGEQAVLNKEIFFQNNPAVDNGVFGYQERYAEYRYKPSRLTGLFNVDAPGSLSSWHLSEDFATLPALGDTFIQSNTGAPLDRAIAVPSEPHFILDAYFNLKCVRPMPLYGVPGNLDHF